MRLINVFIDYYNLPQIPRGTIMKYKQHENCVDYIIQKIDKYCNEIQLMNCRLALRFYGGWYYENGNSSDDRDILSGVINKIFPTVINRRRYIAKIAVGPIDSNQILNGTLRIEQGLPPFFIINQQDLCSIHPCGIESIKEWRKGKCPNYAICKKSDKDIFYTKNQKIVDTLIVGDTIFSVLNNNIDCLILSHDDDLLPSVLYGKTKSKVVILRPDRKKPSCYEYLVDTGYRLINI